MKRRLVFLTRHQEALSEIAEMLRQPHLQGWRWQIFTSADAEVQRLNLPLASPLLVSNMLGGAWRGGFWGLFFSWLLLLFGMSLFTVDSELARNIIFYSLPLCMVFFGGWEGGLLGLMQHNPALEEYRVHAEAGSFVLLVDVQMVDQRLLKKIMAMCNAEQIGEHTQRMWGFPWRENIYSPVTSAVPLS
ncbi:hypothetical protein [Zhongshania aliphaticivorans]|uniref:hypothetical protein n=1 Tax=Zhongshania aliphaticivorans TaxID=1470434 RepID=UPI0012E50605|nr:hypothetical protein [Zhongshania aliphaticivorans]CAA0079993.1 Uncharacterised protein [Zhongshania aliphaticivorans]